MNPRHHEYEPCALTNWATPPNFYFYILNDSPHPQVLFSFGFLKTNRDDNLSLESRNVPYISLVKANSCSVKDLFDNELILIDVSGLEDLSNRFGGKN